MARKNKFSTNPGTGISSILMIFVVLCITTFGVLSFVSARADLRLTEVNVDTVEKYYGAQRDAQRTLAELDALLLKARGSLAGGTPEEQAAAIGLTGEAAEAAVERLKQATDDGARYAVLAAFAAASLQEELTPGDGAQAVYTYPLNETHALRVTVSLGGPGEGERCALAGESIRETGDSVDEPLNVWPGN